jgi:hypothetical protein
MERLLNKTFLADKKYAMEQRGNRTVKVYSVEYSRAYHKMMKGMVQRRMRSSILSVGSFWFSAWVDAGQPDLGKLIKTPMTKEERQKINNEEALFRAGKVFVPATD